MKPGMKQDVIITFDEVSYVKLLDFLFDLKKTTGAQVSLAKLKLLQGKAGMISASLSLAPGLQ